VILHAEQRPYKLAPYLICCAGLSAKSYVPVANIHGAGPGQKRKHRRRAAIAQSAVAAARRRLETANGVQFTNALGNLPELWRLRQCAARRPHNLQLSQAGVGTDR